MDTKPKIDICLPSDSRSSVYDLFLTAPRQLGSELAWGKTKSLYERNTNETIFLLYREEGGHTTIAYQSLDDLVIQIGEEVDSKPASLDP
jgi:hypothetical protein